MSVFTTREITEDLLLLTARSESLHFGSRKEAEKIHVLLASLERELFLLHQRCLRSSTAYKVAVVGLGNVGKSTLLNAVLGMKIAPVSNAPCTANIVEFHYGEEFRLVAEACERLMPQYWNFPQSDSLHDQLCKMVAHNEGAEHEWSRIEVTLPAEILSGGLILADTPGFGAAGEEGQQDNEVIAHFLKNDVAQVFWVVMADQGIGRQELDFYQQFLMERCDDLIVTNAEDWSQDDRKRWKQRFGTKLRQSLRIHFVEGKKAKVAREQHDIAGWEASGAAEICERIRNLKHSDGRVEGVASNLDILGEIVSQRVREIAAHAHVFCPVESARLRAKYVGEATMQHWLQALSFLNNS